FVDLRAHRVGVGKVGHLLEKLVVVLDGAAAISSLALGLGEPEQEIGTRVDGVALLELANGVVVLAGLVQLCAAIEKHFGLWIDLFGGEGGASEQCGRGDRERRAKEDPPVHLPPGRSAESGSQSSFLGALFGFSFSGGGAFFGLVVGSSSPLDSMFKSF